MRKAALLFGCTVALTLILAPLAVMAEEKKVPAGKEILVIDGMSKAKEANKKKVVKGPVSFKHQEHVDRGTTCVECHHETKPGEAPKKCGECHKDKTSKETIKLDDAFHGGENDNMPSLQSCIGCHMRKIYANDASTKAPWQRKPCETCHNIKK